MFKGTNRVEKRRVEALHYSLIPKKITSAVILPGKYPTCILNRIRKIAKYIFAYELLTEIFVRYKQIRGVKFFNDNIINAEAAQLIDADLMCTMKNAINIFTTLILRQKELQGEKYFRGTTSFRKCSSSETYNILVNDLILLLVRNNCNISKVCIDPYKDGGTMLSFLIIYT